jgi:hypothetical protein
MQIDNEQLPKNLVLPFTSRMVPRVQIHYKNAHSELNMSLAGIDMMEREHYQLLLCRRKLCTMHISLSIRYHTIHHPIVIDLLCIVHITCPLYIPNHHIIHSDITSYMGRVHYVNSVVGY